ncbi:hypothetical protein KIPB_006314, partial [Kipferlia bialata]
AKDLTEREAAGVPVLHVERVINAPKRAKPLKGPSRWTSQQSPPEAEAEAEGEGEGERETDSVDEVAERDIDEGGEWIVKGEYSPADMAKVKEDGLRGLLRTFSAWKGTYNPVVHAHEHKPIVTECLPDYMSLLGKAYSRLFPHAFKVHNNLILLMKKRLAQSLSLSSQEIEAETGVIALLDFDTDAIQAAVEQAKEAVLAQDTLESRRRRKQQVSTLEALLKAGEEDTTVAWLKGLGPSAVDLEIRLLDHEMLLSWLGLLLSRAQKGLEYDLVSAWLVATLHVHGRTISHLEAPIPEGEAVKGPSGGQLVKAIRTVLTDQWREVRSEGEDALGLIAHCLGNKQLGY